MCSRQRCGSTPTTLCTTTTPGWFVWASSHSSCWSTSTLRYTKTFRPGKTGDSTQGTEKKSSSTEGCSTEAPIACVTSQLCLLFNNQAEFWWQQVRATTSRREKTAVWAIQWWFCIYKLKPLGLLDTKLLLNGWRALFSPQRLAVLIHDAHTWVAILYQNLFPKKISAHLDQCSSFRVFSNFHWNFLPNATYRLLKDAEVIGWCICSLLAN